MNKYILAFTPDAFRQNFRNLLEDLESLAASIVTLTTGLAGAVLLAGRSGGQTVAGGTDVSEDLVLTSNASGTKDRIFFGSTKTASAYDEVNDRLGVGTVVPAARIHAFTATNGSVEIRSENTSNGASASAMYRTASDTATFLAIARSSGSTATSLGFTVNGWVNLIATAGSGLTISTNIATPLLLGTANATRVTIEAAGDVKVNTGHLTVETAGKGLKVKEGANARMGVATLVAGTLTVNTTAVSTTSRIFLSAQNTVGAVLHGELTVSARVAGTSFTILSANAGDTRIVAWLIMDPA